MPKIRMEKFEKACTYQCNHRWRAGHPVQPGSRPGDGRIGLGALEGLIYAQI